MTGVALIVKSLKDPEYAHRVELTSLNERYVDRVEMGLLRNMNLDEYFIDDSEVVAARANGEGI